MPVPKYKAEFDNVARGGSTRWNGKGPKPARHIPWPEIFKHHLSVVEGHQRMLDMVRKHTVEGTGNYQTIMACLDRANNMLRDTKETTRNWVPPNDRDSVPIGSASDSMYVGYSPADHHYGDAAEEYGAKASKAAKTGEQPGLTADGPEYRLGQNHGLAKKSLKEIREAQKAQAPPPPPRFSSGANGVPVAEKEKPKVEAVVEDNQYFFMDSNPTPAAPAQSTNVAKRGGSDDATRPAKRSKLSEEVVAPVSIETDASKEDISAEVDARLAEKEKKRKEKKEKKANKRKRDSDASELEVPDESKMDVDEPEDKATKPKKKKPKSGKDKESGRASVKEHAVEDPEGKPEKKSKKSKEKDVAKETEKKGGAEAAEDDEYKPAKKSKKGKKDKKDKV